MRVTATYEKIVDDMNERSRSGVRSSEILPHVVVERAIKSHFEVVDDSI